MTKKQITEGNRLITQFMGWELIQTKDELKAWVFKNKETGNVMLLDDRKPYDKKFWNKDSVLEFNESWDWLMPVIDKIEIISKTPIQFYFKERENGQAIDGIKYKVGLNPNRDNNIHDVFIGESISKIEATFISVVEFINWYNKQKK